MDSMEINKIMGAVVGALLIYLGVNFFTDMAFAPGHGDGEHHYAYSVEVEAEEEEAEEEVSFEEILAAANPEKGAKVFGKCKACHKIEDGAKGTGPSLYGVVGRDIGGVEGFKYSGAMAGTEGDWTPEALNAFLEKPKAYVPGTSMSFGGLKKITQRADLIAYLDSLDD